MHSPAYASSKTARVPPARNVDHMNRYRRPGRRRAIRRRGTPCPWAGCPPRSWFARQTTDRPRSPKSLLMLVTPSRTPSPARIERSAPLWARPRAAPRRERARFACRSGTAPARRRRRRRRCGVRRNRDAGERARSLDLAEQFSPWEVDHRNRGVFLILGVEALSIRRDDQAMTVGRARRRSRRPLCWSRGQLPRPWRCFRR